MLVSVIIPTFNRANFIERAIRSVLAQTYRNIEVVVIDDGSSDATQEIVSKYEEIKYFKIENSGVSFARNFGVSKCLGGYIAFLDSDDEWVPDKIELQLNYLSENPSVKIVYANEKWIRNNGVVQKKKHHEKLTGLIFSKCLDQCFIGPSSVLMEKSLFDSSGGFDAGYEVCEDFELWLRISFKNYIGLVDQELVIKYGGHDDQLSTKYPAMDYWRVKALYKFLITHNVENADKDLICSTIEKKSKHLLKGFLKYNRVREYEELNQILFKL